MVVGVATIDGARTRVSEQSLEELRIAARGEIVVPPDPGYGNARALFNLMHPGRPALAVRCTGTADVIEAVNFARQRDLLLAVRGAAVIGNVLPT